MIKIACVGDNVVDINYIDGIVNPGGNCVNVAVYCSQMGHRAVELLEQGIGDRVIAQRSDCIVDLDLEEALAMKKDLDRNLYHIMLDTSF